MIYSCKVYERFTLLPSGFLLLLILSFRYIMNEKLDVNVSIWNQRKAMNRTHPNIDPNITYVDFYLHRPSVAAIFIISYLLIFILCMLGNGVVCFIVLSSKHMRTVTNLFILNLAVSDLLVGIFCMPTTLLDNIIAGNALTYYCITKYINGIFIIWNQNWMSVLPKPGYCKCVHRLTCQEMAFKKRTSAQIYCIMGKLIKRVWDNF